MKQDFLKVLSSLGTDVLFMEYKRLQLKFNTGKGQEELVEEVEVAFSLCLFKRPLFQATIIV